MKKLLLVALIGIFAISGCISIHNSVPENKTVLNADVDVKTSYKLLGKTEATAKGTIILGFIKLGDLDKMTPMPTRPVLSSVFGGIAPMGSKSAIESAAAYKALDNYPEADRMLDPRWRTTVKDYFFFKELESTVIGKAVKLIHN